MSLKMKLLLSYIIIVIGPLLLTIAAYVSLAYAFYHFTYQTEFTHLKKIIALKTERLQDCTYCQSLETSLNLGQHHLGIIVRKGERIIYASDFLTIPEVFQSLPKISANTQRIPYYISPPNGKSYITKQYDFRFKDGTPGSVTQLLDPEFTQRLMRKWNNWANIAAILILIVSYVSLTFVMAISITRPLNQLKKATERIQAGNLDFEVKYNSRNEIGQLAQTFEEMRRQLKASLELQLQYENNRKEMVAGITHDLKTPITAIKGYVEGIWDGVPNSAEKFAKYVQTIYAKTTDIDRLIDELYLFSTLDLKNYPFHFETVNLRVYFEACLAELRFDLENKGIELHFEAPDFLPEVIADREKLRRVIMNVINNSIKYMDPSKPLRQIRITIREISQQVLISIEDTGQGIKPADLPFVFDRFYRADKARNSSTGGSGLGLAITRLIIEEHKGTIWAESEYGQGTKIMFTLPRKR